jgi:serine/threonine protein kinase/tetratricopeptide (TPR) repeat protein
MPTSPTETHADINEICQFLPPRYQPVRKLGQGGMGTVYQCLDKALERQVAIKIMTDRYRSDPQGERRFMREARAQAIVNHPNVATVLNFGVSPEGRLFLVMEYLEGQDLRSIIRQEKILDPIRACDLLRQTCEGLEEAHNGGLVHRDLKPSNLMVVKDHRGSAWVKILDLGLAKIVGGQTDLKSITVDTAGLLIGTPAYMSPEQVTGSTVDGRADIYSLGVVFFEMLTGHLPFESETMEGWLYQHLNTKPPPPSKVNPAIANYPQLDQIVLWMISKQPHERPKTAGELAVMLKRMIERKLMDETVPRAKKSGPRPALSFEDNPPARGSGPRPAMLQIHDVPPPPPDPGQVPVEDPAPSGGTELMRQRILEYGQCVKAAEKLEGERNWQEALETWQKAAGMTDDPDKARERAEVCRREISLQSQFSVIDEAVSTGSWEKAEHMLQRLSAVRANDPRVEQMKARLPKRLVTAWLTLAKDRINSLPEGDLRQALLERLGIAYAQAGNMNEALNILQGASRKIESRVVGLAQAIVEAIQHGHTDGLRPYLERVSGAAMSLTDPAERGRANLEVGLAYTAYGDQGGAATAFQNALTAYSEAHTKGVPMQSFSRRNASGMLRRPSAEMMRSIALSTTTNLNSPKSVKASWEAAVGVVAQAQADAGLVEDSLATAALIEDPWTLSHSLSQVAQVLAKTGRSVEAERVTAQITFSLPKTQALRALAVSRIYRGDLNGAEETFKSINTPGDRILLQGLLATAWSLRGDKGRAEFRVTEAIKSISDVVGARARFQALVGAIEPLLNAGFHDLAEPLVRDAAKLVDLIDDAAERLRSLLQMAQVQENARSARFSATRTMVFSNQPAPALIDVLRRALVILRQVRPGPDRFECVERLSYNIGTASMPVLASELLGASRDEAECAVIYIGLSSGVA